MAKNAIRVEGANEVIEALRGADDIFIQEGKRFIRVWSIYGVKQFQIHTLNAGAVDLGELIGETGYEIKTDGKGVTSTIKPSPKADKYAIYVEEGSRPHWPPKDALQGWADRHGIPVFLVQRKIAREGTEPRYMWRDTYNDLVDRVISEAGDFANELVRKI